MRLFPRVDRYPARTGRFAVERMARHPRWGPAEISPSNPRIPYIETNPGQQDKPYLKSVGLGQSVIAAPPWREDVTIASKTRTF